MSSSHAFTYDSDHEEDDHRYTYDGKEASKLRLPIVFTKL